MTREEFLKRIRVVAGDWILFILILIINASIMFYYSIMIPIIVPVMLLLNYGIYTVRYKRHENTLNKLANDELFYKENTSGWNRFFSSTMLMPPNVRKNMLLKLYDDQ